jgi:hypothetical protein
LRGSRSTGPASSRETVPLPDDLHPMGCPQNTPFPHGIAPAPRWGSLVARAMSPGWSHTHAGPGATGIPGRGATRTPRLLRPFRQPQTDSGPAVPWPLRVSIGPRTGTPGGRGCACPLTALPPSLASHLRHQPAPARRGHPCGPASARALQHRHHHPVLAPVRRRPDGRRRPGVAGCLSVQSYSSVGRISGYMSSRTSSALR